LFVFFAKITSFAKNSRGLGDGLIRMRLRAMGPQTAFVCNGTTSPLQDRVYGHHGNDDNAWGEEHDGMKYELDELANIAIMMDVGGNTTLHV
jgi:hypothetical protein